MASPEYEPAKEEPKPRWPALAALSVVLLCIAGVLVLCDIPYPAGLGPRQPLPFSHRVHVTTKRLSCLFCHTGVARSARAVIPPLETCMLCHQRIIITYPDIAELRKRFRENRPMAWQRVNWVPEFVYFDHSVHIRQGFDCSQCHGEISLMDRVVTVHKFEMGFCITCHKKHGTTHDCFVCHR